MKQAMKSMLDGRPQLKALANAALRSHQLIALNYAVSMTPRYSGAAHPALHDMIAESGDSYRALLNSFLVYKEKLAATTGVQWVNGYLPALDSIAIYCLLAETNPKRYVEIGSGNSTLFARASIRDNKLRTRITSIDPTPRRNIEGVGDEILRKPVETVPLEYFGEIEPGDILFVDNSHRCFTNSDVTVFFVDILPLLNPGTLVHLHDIWLPWDYPADVAQQAYSEQYLLATAMLMGRRIKPVLPNKFVERTPELISILDPILNLLGNVEREGCSFWFKTAPR
jgi:predicted O-methyltransferase YrrM